MPRSAFVVAFLLAMALIASSTSPSASADELLVNAGFESGVGDWSVSHGQLDAVSAPVHGGNRAARLSSSAIQSHDVYQSAAVASGQPYQLSAWAVLDDPAVDRIFLRISWFSPSGGLISLADSPWITIPGAGYQSLTTGDVISPLAAVSARISLRVQASGPFTLYFDDLSFTGAIPPPATPSATPAPSSVPTATPPPGAPTPRPTATAPPDTEPDTFDVLTNGGFEMLRTDGSPHAWREIGAELDAATSPVAEGIHALAVTSRSSSTKWAYQTIRVQPGQFYDTVVYAWSGGASETFLRLSWYASADGSGPAIASEDSISVSAPGNRFERLTTGPIQAPGDARTAKVRLMLRPASAAETTAYFDAVSFGPTTGRPQPEAPPESGSGGPGAAAGRPGSTEVGDGSSTEAFVERYPLDFANVKPAPAPGPAAVSDDGSNYDWLAALGVAVSLGVIAFALFLEWSNRRRSGSDDAA